VDCPRSCVWWSCATSPPLSSELSRSPTKLHTNLLIFALITLVHDDLALFAVSSLCHNMTVYNAVQSQCKVSFANAIHIHSGHRKLEFLSTAHLVSPSFEQHQKPELRSNSAIIVKQLTAESSLLLMCAKYADDAVSWHLCCIFKVCSVFLVD